MIALIEVLLLLTVMNIFDPLAVLFSYCLMRFFLDQLDKKGTKKNTVG
ncbi:hypothetical protein GAB14E_0736 [Colwellia psychrerythraea]|uniref:Uncharacterized protein n=1 Tax=Colwellia psychrerythraea TaxID=28229 RepID=A0A099KA14_COLPS|nr:hypothetical protein GAB14E_0736 [Colwellia psychrerythraea]